MAQRTCSVEGCERKVNSYGYCGMHWLRLQRHGDVNNAGAFTYSPTGLCSVAGCGRRHLAKSYCSLHYQRAKAGRPLEGSPRLSCAWCDTSFEVPYKGNPDAVRFCSHACRYANELRVCAERSAELYARNVAWRAKNPAAAKAIFQRRRAAKRGASLYAISGRDLGRLVLRYRNMCAYCLVAPYEHLDHVIPLSRGGRHSIGNLLPACGTCNLNKAARLLSEWRYVRPTPRRFRARC